jgi:hypothetical protein
MPSLPLLLLALVSSRDLPIVFRDNFQAYTAAQPVETRWYVSGGAMEVRGGRLRAETGNVQAYPMDAPDSGRQTVECLITPRARARKGTWSAAGLMIYQDPANHWRVAVVESPGGERYFELVEMFSSVWQAQDDAATRLPEKGTTLRGTWEYGQTYRLRLSIQPGSVEAEALPAAGGQALFRKGFELPARIGAVRSGRVSLQAVEMVVDFDDVVVRSMDKPSTGRFGTRGPYRVAVHDGGTGKANAMAAGLRRAGYASRVLSSDDVAKPAALSRAQFDAVLFLNGARAPIAAKENLLRFFSNGGDMVVVGGPLFEESIQEALTTWERRLAVLTADRDLLRLDGAEPPVFRRASNNMAANTVWRVEPTGPPAARQALRVHMPAYDGWDNIGTDLPEGFGEGSDLLMFWAKGSARTTALAVELRERDGSRWIGTVPLTAEWRRIVMTPADFPYWRDNPSTGRGQGGDRVRPAEVREITFGLAQSHTNVPAGEHTFWVAGVQAGKLPANLQRPDTTPPTLEAFSPFYKWYKLPSLKPTPEQLRQVAETGHQKGPIVSPIERPRGLGTAGTRRGRWIPLAAIFDTTGKRRGERVSMYVNLRPPYVGSIWAHLAAPEAPATLEREILGLIARSARGQFLAFAGAEQFSYFVGERVPLGAAIVNYGSAPIRATVRQRLLGSQNQALAQWSSTLEVKPGREGRIRNTWQAAAQAAGECRVITDLLVGGRQVDQIVQPITILQTPKAPAEALVRVRGGDFVAPELVAGTGEIRGPARKWYPYGLNYWQSNVAGSDVTDYWLHWQSPGFYDPRIVERDLATFRELGFNAVSIQLNTPESVRQANDFIWRAARHGIRTNVFIAGAHPFYTDEQLFTRLIREGRFAGNPYIWAWDIAWEHHLGPHQERRQWDAEWEEWVIERYGSIEHAEALWKHPIPRTPEGKVTNPSDSQLRGNGPWTLMAVAYERCADDVIARRYAAVIRKLRALNLNQLISARSASQPSWSGWFAYDMVSCGKAFDFSSPEGYGLKPEEAGFSTAYARWAGNGKPVFWAEFGSSLWPYDLGGEKAADQNRLYDGFARMLLKSGANGLAAWWNVGGYRVDERSDFGCIAPDGTPRASARTLQAHAAAVTAQREPPPVRRLVEVIRDEHALAYEAIYHLYKETFVETAAKEGMVEVRTPGTGTTSATVPLTVVGQLPFDSFAPLCYINAEFYWVRVLDAAGTWREVPRNGEVRVKAGQPIRLRVRAGNLGEAAWLAGGGQGAVRLIGDDREDSRSTGLPRLTFTHALPRDVKRYEDIDLDVTVSPGITADHELVLTFEARDRARFGERRRLVLRVQR